MARKPYQVSRISNHAELPGSNHHTQLAQLVIGLQLTGQLHDSPGELIDDSWEIMDELCNSVTTKQHAVDQLRPLLFWELNVSTPAANPLQILRKVRFRQGQFFELLLSTWGPVNLSC